MDYMDHNFFRSMHLAGTLALRQLRSHKTFAMSMIINMALGLTGFMVVDGFNRSFRSEISKRTRQIASADIVISSRQPWTKALEEKIRQSVPPDAVLSEEVSLTSMASAQDLSRLVEARFVGSNFPLYPGLELESAGKLTAQSSLQLGSGEAWIYRELRTQMGLKAGDRLRLGDAEFTVVDTVIDDPTAGAGGFSFAPRIFMRIEDLPRTNLLGLGSRSIHTFRVKLSERGGFLDEDLLAESIRKSLTPLAGHQDLRVRSHRKATDDLTRLQAYVNDYLSLVALIALFLAAVGTSYLMRGHLQRTIKEFAILSSLGAKPWIAPLVFVFQCVLLGLGATVVATLLASGGLPVLAKSLAPIAGMLPQVTLPTGSIIVTSFFAIVSGLLLTFPQLIQLSMLQPSFLFQEANAVHDSQRKISSLAFFPALILWWLTAVQQSKSWETGSIFAAACVGSAIILTLAALPMLRLGLTISAKPGLNWLSALALRQLSRNRRATVSTFLALALGTTLINIIPQLQAMILREISRPDSVIPQLFIFDIQDDQVDSVRDFFSSFGGQVGQMSPMVRARLESVNETTIEDRKMDFEGEREQQQREALQARTQNLSYRTKLGSAETIIRGRFPTKAYSGVGLPELSIEEGFAKRLGLKIGDKMGFDVMGVPLMGQVTSIRKVRWTSFEPNFMILVQPGVLDDAPKIWVTSASGLKPEKLDLAQAQLIKIHSNISAVDVKSAVQRLMGFVDQVSVAVGIVAWLALAGGAGVLYAIAYAQSIERLRSVAILKTLGASPSDALRSILIEYGLISTAAVLFGISLGIAVSWAASAFILKTAWSPTDLGSAAIGFVIVPICLALTWIATRGVKKSSIVSLLQ